MANFASKASLTLHLIDYSSGSFTRRYFYYIQSSIHFLRLFSSLLQSSSGRASPSLCVETGVTSNSADTVVACRRGLGGRLQGSWVLVLEVEAGRTSTAAPTSTNAMANFCRHQQAPDAFCFQAFSRRSMYFHTELVSAVTGQVAVLSGLGSPAPPRTCVRMPRCLAMRPS